MLIFSFGMSVGASDFSNYVVFQKAIITDEAEIENRIINHITDDTRLNISKTNFNSVVFTDRNILYEAKLSSVESTSQESELTYVSGSVTATFRRTSSTWTSPEIKIEFTNISEM